MNEKNCTVLIVGSEELLAEGLRKLLDSSGFQSAVRNLDASSLTEDGEASPEILLLLEFPEPGSKFGQIVRAFLDQHTETRLTILRPAFTTREISDAVEMGAHALILRSISREALAHAIHLVLLDETTLPIPLAAQLLKPGSEASGAAGEVSMEHDFSCRELDILRCLVHGLPNKTIARRLSLGEATVKIQIRQLLKKIGARNRTQAAIWALGRGLAEPAAGSRSPGSFGNSISELALCSGKDS